MYPSVAVLFTLVVLILDEGHAAGAGRAFPIDSENYITEEFQKINPKIDWDHSNNLVDLAGYYANCGAIGTRGRVDVDKQTLQGEPIIGVVDYTPGDRSDVDAVDGYIRRTVDSWTRTGMFSGEIRGASKFGCSVRPGCRGQVSIACLFSGNKADEIVDGGGGDEGKGQTALAFTPEQYRMAESITGMKWDRSHYLENLSGFETDCAMINNRGWPFNRAIPVARNAGLEVVGVYGSAPNRGSTPAALSTILQTFKKITYAKGVGCSVIPDCQYEVAGGRTEMYVVVSCLFEER